MRGSRQSRQMQLERCERYRSESRDIVQPKNKYKKSETENY